MIASDTLWKRFEGKPPILIRLLARLRHGRPLTSKEIAQRSGLSLGKVEFLSEASSWNGIDVPTAKAFLRGCDVDIFHRKDFHRIENYLAGTMVKGKRFPPTFRYLRISPQWETYFRPLLAYWFQVEEQRKSQ